MVKKEIFRQYDIRGIVPSDLNGDVAKYISNAFAYILKEKSHNENPVLTVGRDVRLSSDEIFEGVKEGLLDAGCNVVDLGVCPTPATYFSAFVLNVDGFIMITGSHNPSEYNGLKLGLGKTTIFGDEILNVYKEIDKRGYRKSENRGELSSYNIVSKYMEWLINHFKDLKKNISSFDREIKIVIDAGNGTASNIAPVIFNKLGVKTIDLFCVEDGNFPNHHPDPTIPANLKDLIATVKEKSADFGIAYDGDADRIGVIDENGGIIWGDILLLVYAKELKKHVEKPKVIADVKASQILYDELEKMGIDAIMWKTGHSFIKNKLKEIGGELAGEMSGHVFFADRYFGYDDAIYASIRFLEAYVNMLKNGEISKCSDLFSALPKMFNTPEIRVECPDDKKFKITEILKESFLEFKKNNEKDINDIITIDGIRVIFKKGWGLLRASNTQPELVMRFEAKDENSLKEYKDLFESVLKKII
jgi:phosphomannomutase/phosphoglucomutase